MRILVVNPNTSEEMTRDIGEEARRYARPGTEIETVCPAWGPRSIEGHHEEALAALATLETIRERADTFDGVVIACFGDSGLAAAREVSPVPVLGIAEAAMLLACTVAHRFSVVTVLPRVKPMLESTVRLHGLEARCASIRTTPLTVLDCQRDPPRRSVRSRWPRARPSPRTGRRRSASAAPAWGRSTSGRGRGRRARARRRGLRGEAPRGHRRLRARDEPSRGVQGAGSEGVLEL